MPARQSRRDGAEQGRKDVPYPQGRSSWRVLAPPGR